MNLYEVLRSIHVALLCVQESREARPSISYVVLMLGNKDALPQPKHPGFFIERDTIEASSTGQSKPSSANDCTGSVLHGCDRVYTEPALLTLCGENAFPKPNNHVFVYDLVEANSSSTVLKSSCSVNNFSIIIPEAIELWAQLRSVVGTEVVVGPKGEENLIYDFHLLPSRRVSDDVPLLIVLFAVANYDNLDLDFASKSNLDLDLD
ncbi:unnamed protein product [Dovyalis caffra]|uniref:S-locus receptor kinase C-terminal domain-containing protein n=1 Tax=Dovyalis caffra TaxID=77055 RepID=A0AAV1R189_9ROSI|nr:unnamed protein product [Dovyalis caffra]